MIVRNDGPQALPPQSHPAGAASPSVPAPAAQPAAPAQPNANVVRDSFEGAPGATASAQVGARAPISDHGQLMNEYLTGARPPPADFEEVMGYTPYQIDTPNGPRMQDPDGRASSPGEIGPVDDFDVMAKTHDYGYDLLRYFDRKGEALGPDARKAADAMFRDDLFAHSETKDGFVDRWKTKTWAQIFASAVELNSKAQGYGAP